MIKICAWCNKQTDSGNNHRDRIITHGICESCKEKLFRIQNNSLELFLDNLRAPVLVVNNEGEVLTGNSQALVLIGKEKNQIKGFPWGDVFECSFAGLPNGCGKTPHCQACVIRNSVNRTYSSGHSLEKIPVYQDISENGESRKMFLRISTEKAGDIVLLRIDKLNSKVEEHPHFDKH